MGSPPAPGNSDSEFVVLCPEFKRMRLFFVAGGYRCRHDATARIPYDPRWRRAPPPCRTIAKRKPCVSLDKMLAELANPETSAVKSMVLIVDWLRPGRHEATDAVAERMTGLAANLHARPDLHQQLAERLQGWLDVARFFQLLTGLGLYSRRGFLKEMGERLYERLNPSPVNMTS